MHILWQEKKLKLATIARRIRLFATCYGIKPECPPHKLMFETWFPDGNTILGSCGITEKWAQLEEAGHCSKSFDPFLLDVFYRPVGSQVGSSPLSHSTAVMLGPSMGPSDC